MIQLQKSEKQLNRNAFYLLKHISALEFELGNISLAISILNFLERRIENDSELPQKNIYRFSQTKVEYYFKLGDYETSLLQVYKAIQYCKENNQPDYNLFKAYGKEAYLKSLINPKFELEKFLDNIRHVYSHMESYTIEQFIRIIFQSRIHCKTLADYFPENKHSFYKITLKKYLDAIREYSGQVNSRIHEQLCNRLIKLCKENGCFDEHGEIRI